MIGMEIPKERILELLRQRGDDERADAAGRELPDQVDTSRDAGLLSELGIELQDLLGSR